MTAKKMNIILYFKFKASSSNIFCVIDILVFTSKTLADISRPSDKDGGGNGHPDPEIRGGPAPPKFFSALRASFWSKNKWGGGGGGKPGPSVPSPGSATD